MSDQEHRGFPLQPGPYFHQGEKALQAESGVDVEAFESGVTRVFQPAFSDAEARFVGARTFSVATSIDADHRPWGSPLFGPAGRLLTVEDPVTVRIAAPSTVGDPLTANVAATGELGVLYFDPSRRRRAKSIGRGSLNADGSISYRMHRNFGICNKYIVKRDHRFVPTDRPGDSAGAAPAAPRTGSVLSADDMAQLRASNTVFLSSHHVDNGADATHRGGPPGFVTVVDQSTLTVPDYLGNGMFNTLGNLMVDDRIGLLTVDFDSGRTLHLTGRGEIRPSPAGDPMSVRTLAITIDEVLVTHPEVGIWTDVEDPDYSPGQINPATPYRQPG